MGAATFMLNNKEKARKAKAKGKQAQLKADTAETKEDRVKAQTEANQAAINADFLKEEAKRFGGGGQTAGKEEPDEVTAETYHFESAKAIDLDGDGKPDVLVSPFKE